MVGFDKIQSQQKEYAKLVSVDLSNSCLRGLAEGEEPLSMGVRDLNISDNLIDDWSIVSDICRHLTRLKSLTVSGNREMRSLESLDVQAGFIFGHYSSLYTSTMSQAIKDIHSSPHISRV